MRCINPIIETDAYKLDHRRQYPKGTTNVYSNLTARGSRFPGVDYAVAFGFQAFIEQFLIESFNENFFDQELEWVLPMYQELLDSVLGPNDIGTDHIRALHDLGYLPIRICTVPEGTKVPLRIPMMSIEATHHDFAWLVNYLETAISEGTWLPITSATQAHRFYKLLALQAEISGDVDFVQFQGHDFSMRGMEPGAAASSGAAHLTSFVGSDTLPATQYLRDHYDAALDGNMIGVSVAATEHSVMCAGGQLTELETYDRLLTLYPTGIVSVVSDTWDLWNVITNILPILHDRIMARDGKLVIRPDSGDPVKIIIGDPEADIDSPAYKGVVELLWEEFGGTVNGKGFKELDSHIGAIYGDSISYDRAEAITNGLIAKGFASTQVVLGVGSYTYQYVTRDSLGMAIKATWCEVNGVGIDIMKDPITDDGLKKSATGRLAVIINGDTGELELIESATPEEEAASALQPVFEDGVLLRKDSLTEIRARVRS